MLLSDWAVTGADRDQGSACPQGCALPALTELLSLRLHLLTDPGISSTTHVRFSYRKA